MAPNSWSRTVGVRGGRASQAFCGGRCRKTAGRKRTQVSVGQQVVPVAQSRCARSCKRVGACQKHRVPQVPYRSYVRRLGPEPSHKGQGAVRRQSSGANNVDHPGAPTVRGDVESGERNREQLRREHDTLMREGTSSSVEPMCASKGERPAAQATKGGREWTREVRGRSASKRGYRWQRR